MQSCKMCWLLFCVNDLWFICCGSLNVLLEILIFLTKRYRFLHFLFKQCNNVRKQQLANRKLGPLNHRTLLYCTVRQCLRGRQALSVTVWSKESERRNWLCFTALLWATVRSEKRSGPSALVDGMSAFFIPLPPSHHTPQHTHNRTPFTCRNDMSP